MDGYQHDLILLFLKSKHNLSVLALQGNLHHGDTMSGQGIKKSFLRFSENLLRQFRGQSSQSHPGFEVR